jgi:sporulation protein YlmC with PRC-barrel domain
MQNEIPNSDRKSEKFTGHQVVDPDGHVLGEVSDVVYDDSTNEPAWMVVNPGLIQAEHYAPIVGSYTTDDGRIVVPFDKSQLKKAPKATGSHVLDAATVDELERHYETSTL